MSHASERKLQAAVRYFNPNAKNKVVLIDPALITDFTDVENFNFDIPHTVFELVGGKKVEVPIQVFEISDDINDLLDPPKRRIFDNKRRSDVMSEIVAAREVTEKEREKENDASQAKSGDKSHDQGISKSAKQQAHDLKAIEKIIKEKAKNQSKKNDEQILSQKLSKLAKNKLVYEDDDAIYEQHKVINDLQLSNENQAKEIEKMREQWNVKQAMMEEKMKKQEQLLLKAQQIIEQFQENVDKPVSQKTTIAPALESNRTDSLDDTHATEPFAHKHQDVSRSEKRKASSVEITSSGSANISVNITNEETTVSDIEFYDQACHSVTQHSENSRHAYEKRSSKNTLKETTKRRSPMFDDDNSEEEYVVQKKRHHQGKSADESQRGGHPQTKQDRKQKSRTTKQRTYSESEEDEDHHKIKGTRNDGYQKMRKYANMHSSESETNEEDGNGRERKKFTRLSDDEYLSDNLSTFHVQDYKGFEENSGRKRKMYHLKHGVCIKREHWESMKKMFDAKEYIKFFIHSLYKEEDLIDKAFVLSGCKRDRIPGRIRSEFSADEKAAIRKTFFCWVDKTSQNKKQAKYHKNHWKTYISDHINSLIEREKTKMQRHEKSLNLKRAAKASARAQSSSLSSSDTD